MKTIGQRVRWARTVRGLTQAELDEIAGLSCSHTGSIERDRRESPSAKTIAKIARALKVDAAWLMFGGKAPMLAKVG